MKLFKNHTLNKIDEQNWKYYLKTLSGEISDIWDYIVITATNEKQKEHYEKEISKRQEEKKLPKKIKFLVISDFEGQRRALHDSPPEPHRRYMPGMQGMEPGA